MDNTKIKLKKFSLMFIRLIWSLFKVSKRNVFCIHVCCWMFSTKINITNERCLEWSTFPLCTNRTFFFLVYNADFETYFRVFPLCIMSKCNECFTMLIFGVFFTYRKDGFNLVEDLWNWISLRYVPQIFAPNVQRPFTWSILYCALMWEAHSC